MLHFKKITIIISSFIHIMQSIRTLTIKLSSDTLIWTFLVLLRITKMLISFKNLCFWILNELMTVWSSWWVCINILMHDEKMCSKDWRQRIKKHWMNLFTESFIMNEQKRISLSTRWTSKCSHIAKIKFVCFYHICLTEHNQSKIHTKLYCLDTLKLQQIMKLLIYLNLTHKMSCQLYIEILFLTSCHCCHYTICLKHCSICFWLLYRSLILILYLMS